MSRSRETLKMLIPALLGTTALLTVAVTMADRMIVHPQDGAYRVAAAQVLGSVEDALMPNAATAQNADETIAETTPLAGTGTDDTTSASAMEATAAELSRDGGFGLGREALEAEVAAWDIDIRPDGKGLPAGSGDVWTGEEVWVDNCAMCHGDFGEAVGRWPVIAGGWDTLNRRDPVKTVGSYWPYLSTVYDYIHRAMPFGNAQSLEPDQVYALTAYILYLNNIVEDDFELSNETFLDVEMPNADGFFVDDRAETELEEWRREPCMENCKDSVEIVMRAAVLDVTPDTEDADTDIEGQNADNIAAVGDDGESLSDGTDSETSQAADVADADVATDEMQVAALDPEMVEAGSMVFRKCQACHAVGEGADNKIGPQLNGIVGRPIGAVDGFRYSAVFEDANAEGRVWDEESLAAFLEDPRGYLAGNKMSFRGLPKSEDREAVIQFLASHE